ncbi:hypothetical protein Pan44_12170 [Caulifigura coniformis]|uniref:Uncharacterized protein n=1 Tax=Caulifigura coniformis TaxID=2527983 RepID=A0A517SAP7_9PLAN|nr:hypothetical protein [Caulifigura coniformis]QDT53201.1 hypothetical protein Pan44_12170 [Caulifigura coniformis]
MLRRIVLSTCVCVGLAIFALDARAQDAAAPPVETAPPVPFAVLNIASVERLLKDTEFMFRSIDRPDVYDFYMSILAGNANDLKGVDRTKPVGVMMFLEPGLPPRPMPVLYMPASSADEFIKTAALGRMDFEKVGENRYEVKMPTGQGKQIALFTDGLMYMTPSEILIDERLPDPIKISETLTSRYDVALSLRVNSVPPLLRDVFVTFLRTTTEAEMQRRDGEGEGEYRFRKANAQGTMQALEELLTQVDEITIGWDGNEQLRKGVLELTIIAKPDSDYAKSLKDLAGRPSFFHIAQQDTGKPLTVSLSWRMNKRERQNSAELVEAARIKMTEELTAKNRDSSGANTLCDVAAATVAAGHIDGFVQVAVPEPGKFVVVGGVKLQGASAAAPALVNVLQQIAEEEKNDVLIETNLDSHQGVAFNRFGPKDKEDVKFFGGVPAFWCGAGQEAFWFSFGADKAFDTLRDTMDRVLTSGPAPGGQSDPLVVILRRAAWQSLTPNQDNRFDVTRHELADQAFGATNDAFKVYTRPTESGVRTRLEFDEGFIKYFALFLARQYDRNQL